MILLYTALIFVFGVATFVIGRRVKSLEKKYARVAQEADSPAANMGAAVVESFGMLDAFYPGRIDLGVGRGQRRDTGFKPKPPSAKKDRPPRVWREVDGVVIPLPFDLRGLLDTERVKATMEILQQPEAVAPDFAEQLGDILAMLDGTYEVEGFDVHAVPGERSGLAPWIFGSTRGQSARLAGAHGLPFVASYHCQAPRNGGRPACSPSRSAGTGDPLPASRDSPQ